MKFASVVTYPGSISRVDSASEHRVYLVVAWEGGGSKVIHPLIDSGTYLLLSQQVSTTVTPSETRSETRMSRPRRGANQLKDGLVPAL